MKRSLLILLCAITMFCKSQTNEKYQINYITGTPKVSGYSVKTCSIDAAPFNLVQKTPAPILQVYLSEKNKFVGETLTNEKGSQTKIVDMKLESSKNGKDNVFTIVGKDFSMGFNLVNGFILMEEKSTIVFYTDGVGIWKANRRN